MAYFLDKIAHTIDRYRMVSAGDTVLAAVSGGPDSMAMLYALDLLRERLGIKLAVAHADHGMREGSGRDALFVEAAAANLGLGFTLGRLELAGMLGPGVNKQAAAREARYAFLEETADTSGAQRIAVGHTMDDQAETCLMRELRGSGPGGLASIPPVRGRVMRPLIDVRRGEVMEFLASRGVGYCIDPTNLKTDYLRNRLRLELMPVLAQYNPNIVETLARNAMVMRDENAFMDGLAAGALDGLAEEEGGWLVSLDLAGFMALDDALKRRIVRLAMERLTGSLHGVGLVHVEDVLDLMAAGGTGRGVDLPGGVRAELSYDRALVYLPERAPAGFDAELPLPGAVEIREPGISVSAEVLASKVVPEGTPLACGYFVADKLKGPLRVRSRRPGDFFYPSGGRGRKKLKEFFIDAKTPRLMRRTTPILTCGGEIAWVVGMRADARFDAGDSGKPVVRVTVTKTRR